MYFCVFMFAGNRDDCIVEVDTNDDRQAVIQFRRMWSRVTMMSSVVDGYLFESRGRLVNRATTTHSLDD